MKSRYDLMEMSKQKDITGDNWPDVLTLSLKQLQFDNPLTEIKVTQRVQKRFYLIPYLQWGICYFDDLLLWMNAVSTEDFIEVGDIIQVPAIEDMNMFYTNNLVTRGE